MCLQDNIICFSFHRFFPHKAMTTAIIIYFERVYFNQFARGIMDKRIFREKSLTSSAINEIERATPLEFNQVKHAERQRSTEWKTILVIYLNCITSDEVNGCLKGFLGAAFFLMMKWSSKLSCESSKFSSEDETQHEMEIEVNQSNSSLISFACIVRTKFVFFTSKLELFGKMVAARLGPHRSIQDALNENDDALNKDQATSVAIEIQGLAGM